MSAERPLLRWTRVVGAAVLIAATFLLIMLQWNRERFSGIGPGAKVPEIQADGWLNGLGPDAESLRGKVLVIDEWATWCAPCRFEAPHLVKLHAKYSDRGVVFLGLTREGREDLPQIEAFVREAEIAWPNGYGAGRTLEQFGATGIPAIWVIGRDGRILWNRDENEAIERAIERALSAP